MGNFSDAFGRLRHGFDQAHRDREHLMQETRFQVREQAAETRRHIAEDSRNRRAGFAAFIEEMRSTVRDSAQRTHSQLADFANDLRQGGDVFRRRQPA
ncbi:MAG: hypothetical protein ACYC35_23455 [Pirellulales bacterium]